MAPRRFDWDEAKRRFLAGETLSELARAFGVTPAAVRLAVHDGYRARQYERQQKWARDNRERRVRHAPCPKCGGQMNVTSALCWECNADLRLSDPKEQAPKPGKLDYWPRGKRYALLAVSGQSHTSDHWGTTFSILDRYDMDIEVRRVQASMFTINEKRAELVALVDEMNAL